MFNHHLLMGEVMEPFFLFVAFGFGYVVYRVGLPPMVGYLLAGFALKALGYNSNAQIEQIANLGVLLLLFSIGLKLKLKNLARVEVWAGASLHMLITLVVFTLAAAFFAWAGLGLFGDMDLKSLLLVAFALSFSSTVFAVKVFEERGETSALHAKIAIGILVMQDVFAVLFLTFTTGNLPSLWALVLLGCLAAGRPILLKFLTRVGHRELLLLFGFLLAFGLGAGAFKWVGLKPDLGALVVGILLAAHPKAGELADVLLGFKDLLLIGFFLNIGLTGLPDLQALGIAGLLAAVVVFKTGLFFFLITRFRLRARTALLSSFSLTNYSEFGLIVAAVGAGNGWLSEQWLVIIALALSLTFIGAAQLNTSAHFLYEKCAARLRRFETDERHPDDRPINPGNATIAVFGMGSIGVAAYDYMRVQHGVDVIGVDFNDDKVVQLRKAGRNVIRGDVMDPDFWERAVTFSGLRIQTILLCMPALSENLYAAGQLQRMGFKGGLSAIVQYDDDIAELKAAGVQAVYNVYQEAGAGFASQVCSQLSASCGLREKQPEV
jgi:glutathione-regulated potassium-efflux system ancillary protein KefC